MRTALWPLGRHDDWVSRVRVAEALAVQIGDKRRLAKAFDLLGTYYWREGQHEEAIKFGEEGLKLAEEVEDFSVQLTTMMHLALALNSRGQYKRQVGLHRKVAEKLTGPTAYERHGLAGFPAVVSRGFLAWGLAELGEFQEAESWALKGTKIAEKVNSAFSTVWVNAPFTSS